LDLKEDKIVENILNFKSKENTEVENKSRRCEQHIRKNVTQREGRKGDENEKALWKYLISRRTTEK
jgi:hypothetical protein